MEEMIWKFWILTIPNSIFKSQCKNSWIYNMDFCFPYQAIAIEEHCPKFEDDEMNMEE
jgi:hypothetical protein